MVEEPLYRFKPSVEVILTEKDGVICVIPAGRQKFTIVDKGFHPDGNQPTAIGEIYSGPNDGQRFWVEPGWFERIREWADYA